MVGRWIFGLALLISAFFGPGVASPAQASIVDCLNALIPVGSAMKLAGEAADAEFLQCSAHMSTGDPVFISTVGLVIGAGAAGAFNSEATCQQMTTGQIGKLIADVLTHMGTLSSALKALLGEDGYQALVAFAASETASNIATETPLKSVFEYMSCGCTIYGKAKAVAAVATEYIGNVKQCAAFVGEVGGAILDLAESGADAVGELFGHHEDGPTDVREDYYPQCGEWQFMKETAEVSASGQSIVERITPRPYFTQTRTCSCAAPSRLEMKPAADGLIAVRCTCDSPVNGIYNSTTKACGCRPSEKLQNGACMPCDTETFSQSADGISVVSGVVTQGVCTKVVQSCPAGQTPVRAKAGYYYECKPVCEDGTFYIKRPGDLAKDGVCAACPANKVPDATLIKDGRLQCNECPSGTAAKPGDRTCHPISCANGIDPANPHSCRPSCWLEGTGKSKRLVCGGNAVNVPPLMTCPRGTSRVGISCVADIHEKPPKIIRHRERKQPDTGKITRKRIEEEKPVTRKRTRRNSDELLGPVEQGVTGPSVGDLLNLGLSIGGAIEQLPRRNQGNTATPAMPQAEPQIPQSEPQIPQTETPTADVPLLKHQKD